jgi:hypothetical protein
MDLDALFDHVPRPAFTLGARSLPAFRSIGIAGFYAALLTAIAASLVAGTSPALAVGVSAVAAASFFGWALARRLVRGTERLVAFEHVWAAFGAVALFAWVAATPAAPAFDVLSVSLPIFLAAGRLGCLVVGCCHGPPAGIGPRYGAEHGLPWYFTGVRLFPVQLVEAAALVAVWLAGFAAVSGTPGTATVWFLLAYAVIRFGTDGLRGDTRPHVGAMSVTRLMSALQLVCGLVAAEAWLLPGGPGRVTATTSVLLAACAALGLALHRRRGGRAPDRGPTPTRGQRQRAADDVPRSDPPAPSAQPDGYFGGERHDVETV